VFFNTTFTVGQVCLQDCISFAQKERRTTQAAKELLTSIKEKGPLKEEKPLHQKGRKQSVRIRRVVDLCPSKVGRKKTQPAAVLLV